MAKKRMFSVEVLETDAFMGMPLSTQALFFWLGLYADDDGFVGNPLTITRNVGASQDDLKLLIAKRFLLQFADGVVVLKHWRMHNTLSANRYKETRYLEDKALLLLKENKSYSFESGVPLNDAHRAETGQRQIGSSEQKTSNRRAIDEQKTSADIDIDIDIDKDLDKDKDAYIPPFIPPIQGEESENEPQIVKQRKKYQRKPFVPPTFDEVREYASVANLDIDPKAFYDYFTAPDQDGRTWIDSEGKPVRNWKQKMQTWSRKGGRAKPQRKNVADNFQEAFRMLNQEGE